VPVTPITTEARIIHDTPVTKEARHKAGDGKGEVAVTAHAHDPRADRGLPGTGSPVPGPSLLIHARDILLTPRIMDDISTQVGRPVVHN